MVYASSGASASSFGYTGEQVDANGLVYLLARYYNPAYGRFFQMDPSRQEANPYKYAFNSPVNFTDPAGTFPCPGMNCEDSGFGMDAVTTATGQAINVLITIRETFGDCNSIRNPQTADFVEGFFDQYLWDMTLQGLLVNITVDASYELLGSRALGLASLRRSQSDMDQLYRSRSQAYREGRWAGRVATTVTGLSEIASGAITAYVSFSLIPPTGAATALCEVGSGGTATVACIGIGGSALGVEVVGGVAGSAVALHGLAVVAFNLASGPPGGGGGSGGSSGNQSLPEVKKAVNSEIQHAADQAVDRGVFETKQEALEGLRSLSAQISQQKAWPAGSILDTVHADRVLVPIGDNGLAVYQVLSNGTARLKTVLIAR